MDLNDLVRKTGPQLSTAVVAKLVQSGVAAATARQRVSRAVGLQKLKGLPFPRNARFVYLTEQYGSPAFWKALTNALLEHSVAYGNALAAIRARGNIMPAAHFRIACGSPLAQRKHLATDAVLNRLVATNLLDRFDVAGVGECVALSQRTGHEHEIGQMRARLVAEKILLDGAKDWMRKLGLVSFHQVATRQDEAPTRVGTFAWDVSGPSYIAPLRTWKEKRPKPGFVVCDLLLAEVATMEAVRPFVHKVTTLSHLPNVGRTLPIFLVERFDPQALRAVKEAGIVPATVETLFGELAARGLRQLINLLKDVMARFDPVVIDEIFRGLGAVEGAATNLRGALFQYMAAELARQSIPNVSIDMEQIFQLDATDDKPAVKAEVDVVALEGRRRVHFIECKGYQPGGTIPDEYVAKWLDKTIPTVRKHAQSRADWQSREQNFSFWTTGKLTKEARARIEEAASKTKKFAIDFLDKSGVEQLTNKLGDSALKRTLREHFLEHPLSRAERKRKRPSFKIPPSAPRTMRAIDVVDEPKGDDHDIPF